MHVGRAGMKAHAHTNTGCFAPWFIVQFALRESAALSASGAAANEAQNNYGNSLGSFNVALVSSLVGDVIR
jgi:hypothetical protein